MWSSEHLCCHWHQTLQLVSSVQESTLLYLRLKATFSTKQIFRLLLDKICTRRAEQLHTCKRSESLELSVCVVLLLRPHAGPRNFIYQEMDRPPRRALFRNTHTRTINNQTTHWARAERNRLRPGGRKKWSVLNTYEILLGCTNWGKAERRRDGEDGMCRQMLRENLWSSFTD